ncbi:MAG: tetratricopeptide repeat-containing sensor histidine kinase [Flavobacteriales bacterium]
MFKTFWISVLFFFLFSFQSFGSTSIELEQRLDELVEIASKERFKEADSLIIQFNEVLAESILFKNKRAQSEAGYWLGRLHYINQNRDLANTYFVNSFNLAKEIPDTTLIIKNYYGKSLYYTLNNQYLNSIELLLESIEYATKPSHKLDLITIYQAIAYQFSRLGNANKNIEFLNEALSIATEINDTNFIVYLNTMLYEETENKNRYEHIKNLEPIVKEYNDDNTSVIFYDTYAKFLLEINEYDQALESVNKAFNINKRSPSKKMLQIIYDTFGDVYKNKQDLLNAEKYYLMSFNKAEELNLDLEQVRLSKKLSEIYSKNLDYKKAYFYSNFYINNNDSIIHINKLKEVANITEKYQSERKNQELAKQKLTIKEQENTMLKHQKSKIYLSIFSISLLLLIVIILLLSKYRQALKNKEIEKLNIKNKVIQLNALIEGEEKERKRIAQDLHDGISGDLSAVKYKIDAFTKYELSQNKQDELQDSINLIDQTIDQVRSISHDLAPPILMDMKLNKALWKYCNRRSNKDLEINYQYFGAEDVLNSNQETAIYRIIQELINNIHKHAQASYCLVEIHVYDDAMNIMVEDDGIGISEDNSVSGIGMSNIKSRVLYLNAVLDIDTSQEGTTVTIDVQL